jgi:hypothetical protein
MENYKLHISFLLLLTLLLTAKFIDNHYPKPSKLIINSQDFPENTINNKNSKNFYTDGQTRFLLISDIKEYNFTIIKNKSKKSPRNNSGALTKN